MKDYLNKPVLLSGKPTGGYLLENVPVLLRKKGDIPGMLLIHSNHNGLVGGHHGYEIEGYKNRWAVNENDVGREFALTEETVDIFNLRCAKIGKGR